MKEAVILFEVIKFKNFRMVCYNKANEKHEYNYIHIPLYQQLAIRIDFRLNVNMESLQTISKKMIPCR